MTRRSTRTAPLAPSHFCCRLARRRRLLAESASFARPSTEVSIEVSIGRICQRHPELDAAIPEKDVRDTGSFVIRGVEGWPLKLG